MLLLMHGGTDYKKFSWKYIIYIVSKKVRNFWHLRHYLNDINCAENIFSLLIFWWFDDFIGEKFWMKYQNTYTLTSQCAILPRTLLVKSDKPFYFFYFSNSSIHIVLPKGHFLVVWQVEIPIFGWYWPQNETFYPILSLFLHNKSP